MKKIILSALLISTSGITSLLYAQTTVYNLSKALTVGCYNANPLTDITKKVTVEIKGEKTNLSVSSLNCTKTIEGQDMGIINEQTKGHGFYDVKEKRGFILEGDQQVIIFNNKEGSFEITHAGHTDKKEAKTLDLSAKQSEYANSFSNFDQLIADANKKAEEAEKLANILPIPEGDFSDKYGMGGLYYFSELTPISSHNDEIDGKYAQALLMHFDESDNFILKAYITNSIYDKYYFDGSRMFKAFKEGKITTVLFHTNDNMNSAGRNNLTRLEDGVYLIGGFLCSEAEKGELKTHTKSVYPLLGKDKSRIEYLKNHPEEVERLALLSTYNQCKLNDALEAAEKPMPAASAMNTGQLKIEATELTKAFAKGRWSQEVIYSYISGAEWYTLRNKLTGVITGRVISAIAIMKTDDGSCKWEEISIRQDYNGSTYGKSYFGGESTVIIPVDCTTAMKYK